MKGNSCFSNLYIPRSLSKLILLLSFLLFFISCGHAQKRSKINTGDRIQISVLNEGIYKQEVTFERIEGVDLIAKGYYYGMDTTYRIPLYQIDYLGIRRSQGNKIVKGILIGAGAGTLFGAMTLALEDEICFNVSIIPHSPRQKCEQNTATIMASSIFSGAAIGCLFGALNKKTKWNKIEINELIISSSNSGDMRFKAGICITF